MKLAKNDNYKLICWRVALAHLLAKSPWRYGSDTMIPVDSRRLFGLAPCYDSQESWLYMNPNVSLNYPVPHLYSIFQGKWRLLNGPRSGLCPWQDTALVHFWCWSCVSWPCEGWIRRCHSSHQSIGIGGEENPAGIAVFQFWPFFCLWRLARTWGYNPRWRNRKKIMDVQSYI